MHMMETIVKLSLSDLSLDDVQPIKIRDIAALVILVEALPERRSGVPMRRKSYQDLLPRRPMLKKLLIGLEQTASFCSLINYFSFKITVLY